MKKKIMLIFMAIQYQLAIMTEWTPKIAPTYKKWASDFTFVVHKTNIFHANKYAIHNYILP